MFPIRFYIVIFLLTLSYVGVVAQDNFRVLFYNVENLFDTIDNPHKDDNDFLPDGFMRWSEWKYWAKIDKIAKVITAVGGMNSPALVGLCEIENDSVLYDLTIRSALGAQGYEFIVTDSPDSRGINVALLFQKHQFKLIEFAQYEIKFSDINTSPTRNILHSNGTLLNKDTLDIFVCHFPSRVSGKTETENARIESAKLLRNKVDSILSIRTRSNIIIMGDFNDEPHDKSMIEILNAKQKDNHINDKNLYNLFFINNKRAEYGTYKYQGVWSMYDQIIVSGRMLNGVSPIQVENSVANIYRESFLLERDEKYYGLKPFRTNIGPRYNRGFSDHLPIYLDLKIMFDE